MTVTVLFLIIFELLGPTAKVMQKQPHPMTQQIIQSLNLSLIPQASFLGWFEHMKRNVNSNTGGLLHGFVQAGRLVLANLCA